METSKSGGDLEIDEGNSNIQGGDEVLGEVSTNNDHDGLSSNSKNNDNGDGKGWYPGKYLGRKLPENSEESNKKDEDEKEKKNESMICVTVRSIREKYLERQLVGRIYIYRLSGVISTAVTSEVTTDDIVNYYLKKVETQGHDAILENDPLMQAEVTGQYKRALSTVDTILNSLERRSLAYSTADFNHTTLLTRGTTIGVSDPFFGLIGFSFTLELSATAHSLLASRRRFEIARDLALDIKRREEEEKERERERSSSSSTSPFSRISFSFFGRKSEKTLDTSITEDNQPPSTSSAPEIPSADEHEPKK